MTTGNLLSSSSRTLGAATQTAVTPVWKRLLFKSCHLDRDTPALFEGHNGFEIVELDRIHEFVTPLRVMARSTLRRR